MTSRRSSPGETPSPGSLDGTTSLRGRRGGVAATAQHGAVVALLLVAVWAVFEPTLEFDFVDYDDDRYVTENHALDLGLSREGVVWAFVTAGPPLNTFWQPITWLTLLLDTDLYGESPRGFHLTNLLLHALNTLLVYAFLHTLTRAVGRSALVAALFAVHPLHVEPVAWVSERKELVCAAFALFSLWAYASWSRRGRPLTYAVCALTLALALMSKPMAVTLPFLLLLLDDWPLDRLKGSGRTAGLGRLALEKLPLFVLAAAGCAIALGVQGAGYRGTVSLPDRLANALVSYARYLGKTFWPRDLGVLYPHPYIAEYGLSPWTPLQIGGAALLLIAITALAIASRRGYARVGWLWFLGTLVPVIGLVQHSPFAMADRYSYFPLIGLFVALVWAGTEMVEVLSRSRHGFRRVAALGAAVALVACVFVARAQVAHWRDSVSLFRHALAVAPDNPDLLLDLGAALGKRGQNEEAIDLYNRSLELGEGYAELHYNIGGAYVRTGDFERAASHYDRALVAPRRHVFSRFGYAQVHFNLGGTLAELGRHAEAVPHFEEAIQRGFGGAALARIALADALWLSGDAARALRQYEMALRIDPQSARAQRGADRARLGVAPGPASPTERAEAVE